METQAKDYEKLIRDLTEEKQGYLDDIELLEEKLGELDTEGSTIESQLAKLRNDNHKLKSELRDLNELNRKLRSGNVLDELDNELSELRKRLQQAESDNDELIIQLKEATQKAYFHDEERDLLKQKLKNNMKMKYY